MLLNSTPDQKIFISVVIGDPSLRNGRLRGDGRGVEGEGQARAGRHRRQVRMPRRSRFLLSEEQFFGSLGGKMKSILNFPFNLVNFPSN